MSISTPRAITAVQHVKDPVMFPMENAVAALYHTLMLHDTDPSDDTRLNRVVPATAAEQLRLRDFAGVSLKDKDEINDEILVDKRGPYVLELKSGTAFQGEPAYLVDEDGGVSALPQVNCVRIGTFDRLAIAGAPFWVVDVLARGTRKVTKEFHVADLGTADTHSLLAPPFPCQLAEVHVVLDEDNDVDAVMDVAVGGSNTSDKTPTEGFTIAAAGNEGDAYSYYPELNSVCAANAVIGIITDGGPTVTLPANFTLVFRY